MLNIEEIKKACEFAEGFEEHERSCSSFTITYNKSCFEIEYDSLKYSANTEIYELFLQRVLEGINNKSDELDLSIVQNRHYVEVINWECNVLEHYSISDEGKEKAISYVLSLYE